MTRTSAITSKDSAFALIEAIVVIAMVLLLATFILSAVVTLSRATQKFDTFTREYLESRKTYEWGDGSVEDAR
jgi:type II secretory pathway pseudopilin PulG